MLNVKGENTTYKALLPAVLNVKSENTTKAILPAVLNVKSEDTTMPQNLPSRLHLAVPLSRSATVQVVGDTSKPGLLAGGYRTGPDAGFPVGFTVGGLFC